MNIWGSLQPSLNASASAVQIHHSNFAQARFCLFLRTAFEDLTVQQTGHCIYKASIKSVVFFSQRIPGLPISLMPFLFPDSEQCFQLVHLHRQGPLCHPLVLLHQTPWLVIANAINFSQSPNVETSPEPMAWNNGGAKAP